MNATTKIEKEYKEFLNELKNRNMTAEAIQSDYFAYNDAAEKTFEYLSKVALLSVRNRSLINATGYDFDMYASDITMHLLNKKLDGILSCDNDGVIPYIIQAVNWQVIDMFRKWKREYPDVKKKSVKGSNSNNNELINLFLQFFQFFNKHIHLIANAYNLGIYVNILKNLYLKAIRYTIF